MLVARVRGRLRLDVGELRVCRERGSCINAVSASSDGLDGPKAESLAMVGRRVRGREAARRGEDKGQRELARCAGSGEGSSWSRLVQGSLEDALEELRESAEEREVKSGGERRARGGRTTRRSTTRCTASSLAPLVLVRVSLGYAYDTPVSRHNLERALRTRCGRLDPRQLTSTPASEVDLGRSLAWPLSFLPTTRPRLESPSSTSRCVLPPPDHSSQACSSPFAPHAPPRRHQQSPPSTAPQHRTDSRHGQAEEH